ncbi:acetylcholinesterase-like [Gordionus sp. m RMFG-2023]|uniref:acetylcholinesterase-like n=1 Tax=Gordionus sp. m RMFG-2023 TaxID=3053472 RepID=UPI0031FD6DFE
MGIPYAKPPINELRFQSPQPIDPFFQDSIYNATSLPNSCPQPIDNFFGANFKGTQQWNANTDISEDCLYLNIWSPFPRNENEKLPVMIWIYGGSYTSGSATLKLYDGKILASRFHILVASMNYRMGSLGFLFTNDPIQNPGNAGLLDQLLAIKWLKRNIEHFGGDPERITLVGESAGASSIVYHLLSPSSAPYFNRVILQSGAAGNPWGLIERSEAIQRAFRLGQALGCDHDTYYLNETKTPLKSFEENEFLYRIDGPIKYESMQLDASRKLLKCLQSHNFENILNKEPAVTSNAMDFPFAPVIDGDFVKAHPQYLLNMGLFKKASVLLGSNLHEGTAFLVYYLDKIFTPLRENVTVSNEELIWAINRIYYKFNHIARNSVAQHYKDWDRPESLFENEGSDHNINKIDDMAGDYWFTCHVNELADQYSKGGQSVYMYQFSHRSSLNPWPKWMGVMHGDEIAYMLGEPLKIGSRYTDHEKDLSLNMMRFWTNFIKHGDPNKNGEYDWTGIRWPEYSYKSKDCLDLNIKMNRYDFNITKAPRLKHCAFQTFLSKLQKDTELLKLESSCPVSPIPKKSYAIRLNDPTNTNINTFNLITVIYIVLNHIFVHHI